MTTDTLTDSAILTAARAIDEHDGLGYFTAENLAGIADLVDVAQVAIDAAREVADGLADHELVTDPVCVATAAVALAEREGSDAFAVCDADATEAYRADARVVLGALTV